jgi:hypothetical protein
VAGADTSLVSMECVVADAGVAGTATLLALHFSIYYDSLIEKCSTLPVVQALAGSLACLSL